MASRRAGQVLDYFVLALILATVAAVIIGTVPEVQASYGAELAAFEVFSLAVFSVEYVVRLWLAPDRWRYARSPLALIDLAAVLPFYLPFLGVDLRVARAFRLLRFFRIAKAARYTRALHVFADVARAKREEMVVAGALMGILLLGSASLMYYAEHAAQPEKFPSIPATLWWAVMTLTTVGYGDVFPVTSFGRFAAGLVSIIGVGFFALPTAILGSGFVEAMARRNAPATCPHCGRAITSVQEPRA
jgi:voltage-gated potassium channel